ncbi:hypothetical protein [Arthrobacter sp. NyZ413]|uniref:hypothetical protein n=1 Tax=Arthrobacter sp. NyZ413 TaxID=3144669 RepID=UPI003BF82C1B
MERPEIAKDWCSIRVYDRIDMDIQLNQAEAQLRASAQKIKERGILITRPSETL